MVINLLYICERVSFSLHKETDEKELQFALSYLSGSLLKHHFYHHFRRMKIGCCFRDTSENCESFFHLG